MSASGLSRASSGKRASFMDPTASSAVKEREKATPSRQPSARSNVSAVPTTGGGSSPRSDNAKTIESFLQDARNAVGIGSPGAGSQGYSPRVGSRSRSRAQSPSSPGPRGAERSRSVSPGRAERTANRAASSTTLRWNAPLPGDTLARSTKAPGSPGTPAVFSAGTRGADAFDAFAGTFGGVGSYSAFEAHSPARALARAAHARFDPRVDPALRFGVKNLGGNPAVATSLLPTFGPSALFGGTSGGVSGATFGDVFSRERAASLTQFREAALMRDQIRAEGGLGGLGADTAAKAEIERLEAAVAELASEVRAFRAGKAETKKKRRNEETKETKKNGDARAARDDDSAEDDDLDDDENASGDENSDRAIRSVVTSPASSSRSLDALVRNRRAADPSKLGSLIRAATLGASRESFLSEAADETETSREDSLGKKSVEAAADLRRASPDRAGRYLRTTRRDAEAARYARGLKSHSGSPASEFWGEGRGAVQGGGAVGGGIEGANEGGVEDADLEETREREKISRRIANRRNKATKETDARAVSDGFAGDSRIGESRAEDAAAAFAAALSAVDARRAARPDPAVTIARLTERNRALRRELGVAQRLMTGYHAQLMTGGAAFTFTELTEPTEVEAQSRNAPFGGAARAPPPAYAARRFSRRPFEAPRVVSRSRMQFQSGPREPLASLRSTRRAESKRTAAELAVLRAERAFAETAAEADAAGARADADESETECSYDAAKESTRLGAARIAEEIAALKETVAGLVRRMDADTRTREACEEELSGPRALETGSSRSFAKRSEGNGEGNGDAIADERGTNANVAETLGESFAESRFAGERRKGERLDGTVRDRSRASPHSARQKRDKDAIPASENSFAFDDDDDDDEDDANGANERSRRDSVTSVTSVTPPTPRSPRTPLASSPAMSLETDTAFLQTPAGPSPSGGAAESRRADAP